MQKKMIDTLSGAREVVYEDGFVERAGTAHISMSRHQYEEGVLSWPSVYEGLVEGQRLHWMGRMDGDIEPIHSSNIVAIEVVGDTTPTTGLFPMHEGGRA